jgi:hypothetical protein
MKNVLLFIVLVFGFSFSAYSQQGVVGTSRYKDPLSGRIEAIRQHFNSASAARTEWNKLGLEIRTDREAISAARQELLLASGFETSTEGRMTNHGIFMILPSGWVRGYYFLIIDGEPVAIGR